MQIQLSRGLARFNRKVTNRLQRSYAWVVPPWAVICHRGRRSGQLYRTPVLAFKQGDVVAVVILYGERSDWVQNVLAGDASLVRAGRTYRLSAARVTGPSDEGAIPPAARTLGRMSGKLLVANLALAEGGFGPGPRT